MTNILTYLHLLWVFIQYIASSFSNLYGTWPSPTFLLWSLWHLTLTYFRLTLNCLPSLISSVLDLDLPSFSDLYGTWPWHHIPGGQVLRSGCITLHVPLPLWIDQIASLSTGSLCDETPSTIYTCKNHQIRIGSFTIVKYTWAPQTVHNTPVMNILKGYFYWILF